jgi:hypothetical protein
VKTNLPTKADLRRQLEQQMEEYLRSGGEVQRVANGVSGRYDGGGPLQMRHGGDEQPRGERTYVPEVVAAIEERRQQLTKGARRGEPGSRRRPRKKIIYDDFGEPLRWQWEE